MSSLLDSTVHFQILLWIFVAALILGAVANKTNFCTMGAVSDWVNMGDTGRMRAWLFAIGVAVLGVVALEAASIATLRSNTMPPYRTENFAWLRYIVGGFVFGVGMTLAGGCGSKTLLRIGGGNLKSLVVAALIGLVAYLMFTTALFNVTVMSWVGPTVLDLREYGIAGQGVDDIVSGVGGFDPARTRLVAGIVVGFALVGYALWSVDFRASADNVLGGAVVGLAVVAGWFVTAGPLGAAWWEEAMMSGDPNRAAVQSFTFISPIGEATRYLMQPTNLDLLRVGVVSVFGVVIGSFLYAIASRGFRIEWFRTWSDFASHVVGGVLMGFGGFTAMGCTIGQGVSGTSTLALGSFIALAFMILGSATTMKIQYRLME